MRDGRPGRRGLSVTGAEHKAVMNRSVTRVDPGHERPAGVSDATVEAVGKLSESLEYLERAKGRLYDFHQLMGRVDRLVQDAADELEAAGHPDHARLLRQDVIGRNVIEGRWTFQIVEEFGDAYETPFRRVEDKVRGDLLAGRKHVFEAEMKVKERSPALGGAPDAAL
jgi:hypothetical protein